MSSSLYAQPFRPKKGKCLSDSLKFALRNRYEIGNSSKPNIFNQTDLPYLQGLYDAGLKDAMELIDLIQKHKDEGVEVWLEY